MGRVGPFAATGRGRAAASAVLAVNRMVWMLMLAVWVVVLGAGTYLGRVHLRGAGVASLAVTAALGLAYVLSHGRGGAHRWLGVAANALLGLELAFYFARRIAVSDARLLAGSAVALVVLAIPLYVLLAVRPDDT